MKAIMIVLAVLLIGVAAYYLILPAFVVIEADEASPLSELPASQPSGPQKTAGGDGVQVIASGAFVAHEHDVAGTALLIENDGQKTVRFEDFDTVNGPDLHIYLAADLKAADYVDLGAIKATKGNVNYDIPAGTDTAKYNKVLVWCEPFRVLFSYAELE